jgi:hypothetical protein
MNDVIDTITGASIIALLSVGCSTIKQPEPVQTQAPVQTIEQFFSPPPPGVKSQSAQAKIQPPNWPPHLHMGTPKDLFPLDIPTLDVFILQGDVPLTF